MSNISYGNYSEIIKSIEKDLENEIEKYQNTLQMVYL